MISGGAGAVLVFSSFRHLSQIFLAFWVSNGFFAGRPPNDGRTTDALSLPIPIPIPIPKKTKEREEGRKEENNENEKSIRRTVGTCAITLP